MLKYVLITTTSSALADSSGQVHIILTGESEMYILTHARVDSLRGAVQYLRLGNILNGHFPWFLFFSHWEQP